MDIYKIIKAWFEFAAENNKITPTHTALIFYCLDLNNRLAWKETFGLPVDSTCEYLHISANTFRKVFNELVEMKMIKLVKKSKNQYAANQISMGALHQNLLKQPQSNYKAFVKAQRQQLESTCAIDIHKDINTLNINTLNNKIKELMSEIEFLKNKKNQNNPTNLPEIKNQQNVYVELLNFLNSQTKKNYRSIPDKAKKQIDSRLKENYTIQDIEKAITNCAKDKYHIENPNFLTLEFISRADKFEKYLNWIAPTNGTPTKPTSRVNLKYEPRDRSNDPNRLKF